MLTARERNHIEKTIKLLQKLLGESPRVPKSAASEVPGGRKRARKEADVFRKKIHAAHKKGVAVSRIAEANGVTPSYIYQILRKS